MIRPKYNIYIYWGCYVSPTNEDENPGEQKNQETKQTNKFFSFYRKQKRK